MPGSFSSPTIVCVFPDPVAPYAKTVPFRPFKTPSIKTLPVRSYTSLFVAVFPNAQSYVYRRSFVRPLRRSRYLLPSSGSKTTTVRLSITRRMSLRTPRMCSSASTGRVRTATIKEAELTESSSTALASPRGDVGAGADVPADAETDCSYAGSRAPYAGSSASPPREWDRDPDPDPGAGSVCAPPRDKPNMPMARRRLAKWRN